MPTGKPMLKMGSKKKFNRLFQKTHFGLSSQPRTKLPHYPLPSSAEKEKKHHIHKNQWRGGGVNSPCFVLWMFTDILSKILSRPKKTPPPPMAVFASPWISEGRLSTHSTLRTRRQPSETALGRCGASVTASPCSVGRTHKRRSTMALHSFCHN